MPSHRTRVVFIAGAAALLLALGIAVSRSSENTVRGPRGANDEALPRAHRPVVVESASSGEAARSIVVPGRVRAREEAVLAATVGGRLTALAAEGESFRRGDRLAAFDAPEMREAVAFAQAALQSAEVQADVARRQAARVDSLFDRGVVARRQQDEARAARETAEAAETGARAALSFVSEGARVAAPFDGVVVRRLLDPGSTVAAGTPLLSIRSAEAGEIEVSVPESRLEALAGAALDARVGDGDWRPARLVRIEGMTDPATRTRLVRVALDEERWLPAGAFARVRFRDHADGAGEVSVESPDARRLFVRESALVRRGSLVGVFLEEAGTARLAWLRVGRRDGDRVEILAGIDAADRVIVDPVGLADGDPVRVVEAVAVDAGVIGDEVVAPATDRSASLPGVGR